MKLSVVTTLYHSETYVAEFFQRISDAISKLGLLDYEIIFVDDGSPDASTNLIKQFEPKAGSLVLVELSKNYGHHKALMTGLSIAKGDFVFILDSDLEEAPELIIDFFEYMQKVPCDSVYGIQKARTGNILKQLFGYLFYKLLNFLSTTPLPSNISTARLMTKQFANSVLQYTEKTLSFHAICCTVGFLQHPVNINKPYKGKTTYTFKRNMLLAIDSITSFSEKPLYYIAGLGLIILLVSIVYIAYLVFRKIFFHMGLLGWPSLIVSIWFLGGILLFSMGIIGLYISRIFLEVKNRPLTIIKKITTLNGEKP